MSGTSPGEPDNKAARLRQLCSQLNNSVVVCIGDCMLDRYVYGSVERISPEAPIPILHVSDEQAMPGGAGNVAVNLAALGADVRFLSVIGEDTQGADLRDMLADVPGCTASLVPEGGRRTTVKTRFVGASQQILRADRETIKWIDTETLGQMESWLRQAIPGAGALVISDYGKGVLSDPALAMILKLAAKHDLPVVVDPKGQDYSRYRGALLVSPNLREFQEATGRRTDADTDVTEAAVELQRRCGIENVLVTRGADGMILVEGSARTTVIPTFAQEVFDVSGAGDTAIATLACAVAAGASLVEAAELANLAAGIAVSKLGTATVFNDDLRQLASGQPGFARKVVSGTRLMTMLEGWRETGLSVGFTNGCFDLLHPGHVSLLHRARGMCDRLIVGLNADASVKRLKGEGRPLQDEASRAIVLASLADVDAVILFTEDTPLALIEAVRPNILFKGADYTVDTVVGADAVQKTGGRVELIPLEPNQSTTAIVDRISAD